MKFKHHDMEIELDDSWWREAGMSCFFPTSKTYRVDTNSCRGCRVNEIPIEEVGPVHRVPSVGIFNDNEEATARERVVFILKGFRAGDAIPPVKVVLQSAGAEFQYKLVAGAHRLYCSLAAGFSHIPAIEGFDINALDE